MTDAGPTPEGYFPDAANAKSGNAPFIRILTAVHSVSITSARGFRSIFYSTQMRSHDLKKCEYLKINTFNEFYLFMNAESEII